jgi:hypothetical protein
VRHDILQALAGVDQVFICLEDDAGLGLYDGVASD